MRVRKKEHATTLLYKYRDIQNLHILRERETERRQGAVIARLGLGILKSMQYFKCELQNENSFIKP